MLLRCQHTLCFRVVGYVLCVGFQEICDVFKDVTELLAIRLLSQSRFDETFISNNHLKIEGKGILTVNAEGEPVYPTLKSQSEWKDLEEFLALSFSFRRLGEENSPAFAPYQQ